MSDTPTPMTKERLDALLNSSMVAYIASRTTEDWLSLGEAHPAAIVREMAAKILLQERELAQAREELAENEGVIAVWRGRTERAEAELARVNSDNLSLMQAMHALTNAKDKAEVERDAARKDAERYRWLRNPANADIFVPFDGPESLDLEALDAAIDAAMREGK